MTLLDRLLLAVFVVMFGWQVIVPLWRGQPVFPLLRGRGKGRE